MNALRVAIQGEVASFHDQAAHRFFADQPIEIVCCKTFREVFEALQNGSADMAVCAIENTLHGAIYEIYDLLLRYHFWICGEVYERIEQCLITLPDVRLKDIKEVYSHPVALAQCQEFLTTELSHAKHSEHYDTAGAVADVARWQNPTKAAIASAKAAEYYRLQIIKRGIETDHQNYTRFVVLRPQKVESDQADKTSLVLETNHTPGALHRALGALAEQNLNLSLLISRPVIGAPWHYRFYIDIEAGLGNKKLQQALEQIHEQGNSVTILGSYKAATRP